eukprot:CAMPEP_0194065442 /NCGR_PEP_ID=MMETSP0009_2-20130614/85466_1 /TAXON_ID=210454 /ORGANISM="Grammatophora oceanica, Strain CCMP 410" /LENGTH=839 /DNA_ID=CAMNT_0038718285 /DNA_START=108 /DNA_END=2627 /DNA_ORIENTATION=-
MAALSLISLIITSCAVGVSGHGYLLTPRGKQAYSTEMGRGDWQADKDLWPLVEYETASALEGGDTYGVCGRIEGNNYIDYTYNWLTAAGTPMPWTQVAQYIEGQEITIETIIRANHRGYFEIGLCVMDGLGTDVPTQACFDANKLEMLEDELYGAPVDPAYPTRAYLPPDTNFQGAPGYGGPVTGGQEIKNKDGLLTRHRFKLPDGVHGDQVYLQWHWITFYGCVMPGWDTYDWPTGWDGWTLPSKFCEICSEPLPDKGIDPQQYWNCAQVKILSGDTPVSTTPAPTPLPQGNNHCASDSDCPGSKQCARNTEDQSAPLVCCSGTIQWSFLLGAYVCREQQVDNGICSHNLFCVNKKCTHVVPDTATPQYCCEGGLVKQVDGVQICRTNSGPTPPTPPTPTPPPPTPPPPTPPPPTPPPPSPTPPAPTPPSGNNECAINSDCAGTTKCALELEDTSAPLVCCPTTKNSDLLGGTKVCRNKQIDNGICSHNAYCASGQCAHYVPNTNAPKYCCSGGLVQNVGGVKVCQNVPADECASDSDCGGTTKCALELEDASSPLVCCSATPQYCCEGGLVKQVDGVQICRTNSGPTPPTPPPPTPPPPSPTPPSPTPPAPTPPSGNNECAIDSDCAGTTKCALELEDTSAPLVCCPEAKNSDLVGGSKVCKGLQVDDGICSHNTYCASGTCHYYVPNTNTPKYCCRRGLFQDVDGVKVCQDVPADECARDSDCAGTTKCALELEDASSPLVCCSTTKDSDLLGGTRVCRNNQVDNGICSHNAFCASGQCGHLLQDSSTPKYCCVGGDVATVDKVKLCKYSAPDGSYCTNDNTCQSTYCFNNQCYSS